MQTAVIIKPNAKHKEEVIQADDGSLVVYTKAPAIEGKANQAAIELLAKHYGVSKSQIQLLRGHTSKRKIFKINM